MIKDIDNSVKHTSHKCTAIPSSDILADFIAKAIKRDHSLQMREPLCVIHWCPFFYQTVMEHKTIIFSNKLDISSHLFAFLYFTLLYDFFD